MLAKKNISPVNQTLEGFHSNSQRHRGEMSRFLKFIRRFNVAIAAIDGAPLLTSEV